jgi:hypothetical protein
VLATCHLHQPRCPVATKEQGVRPLKEGNLRDSEESDVKSGTRSGCCMSVKRGGCLIPCSWCVVAYVSCWACIGTSGMRLSGQQLQLNTAGVCPGIHVRCRTDDQQHGTSRHPPPTFLSFGGPRSFAKLHAFSTRALKATSVRGAPASLLPPPSVPPPVSPSAWRMRPMSVRTSASVKGLSVRTCRHMQPAGHTDSTTEWRQPIAQVQICCNAAA